MTTPEQIEEMNERIQEIKILEQIIYKKAVGADSFKLSSDIFRKIHSLILCKRISSIEEHSIHIRNSTKLYHKLQEFLINYITETKQELAEKGICFEGNVAKKISTSRMHQRNINIG